MKPEIRETIAVVVASLGRPVALRLLLERLARQSYPAHRIILSLESTDDAPDLVGMSLPLEVIYGPRGSSAQRNRALDLIGPETAIVAIFDDDYVPSDYCLDGIARAFAAFPHASGLGGVLLADGAKNEGIAAADAVAMVEERDAAASGQQPVLPSLIQGTTGVYGCNMTFRAAHIGQIRFDEGVPLYGWMEDTDFGARLPGPFLYTDAFWGVHCAVKAGREAKGMRFGYSQVANPIYFWRKGTLNLNQAISHAVRPILANIVKARNPEPWVDRAGRLRGNLKALTDLLCGRLNPRRILDI